MLKQWANVDTGSDGAPSGSTIANLTGELLYIVFALLFAYEDNVAMNGVRDIQMAVAKLLAMTARAEVWAPHCGSVNFLKLIGWSEHHLDYLNPMWDSRMIQLVMAWMKSSCNMQCTSPAMK